MNSRAKRAAIRKFKEAIDRALALYDLFITNGGHRDAVGAFVPYRVPDKRDAAAFIFFEAAAKFEGFCYFAFLYDTCRWYRVTSTRAEFLMGTSDRGTESTFGWAMPKKLKDRGKNLLTKESLFGDLHTNLGGVLYERLGDAHELRNRVAHDPSTARTSISAIAVKLGVPTAQTKFLSVGRLLTDYPNTNAGSNRYFHIFVQAFRGFALKYEAY